MPKKMDLTGKTYGYLTVIRSVKGNSRYLTWECRCRCGNIVYADSRQLRMGTISSCEDCRYLLPRGKKAVETTKMIGCGQPPADLKGKRFGKLVALFPVNKTGSGGSVVWRCRCDCGNEVEVTAASLNKGNNRSCGCLKEVAQQQIHDRLHLVDGTCVEWLDGRKQRSDNASGHPGVFKKKNGRYSVSIGFKKKIFHIGVFDNYEDAVEARIAAEKIIHDGFLKDYNFWNEQKEKNPGWEKQHPFSFEVTKENGVLTVHSSVRALMEQKQQTGSA